MFILNEPFRNIKVTLCVIPIVFIESVNCIFSFNYLYWFSVATVL
jgi:hypothetical protein